VPVARPVHELGRAGPYQLNFDREQQKTHAELLEKMSAGENNKFRLFWAGRDGDPSPEELERIRQKELEDAEKKTFITEDSSNSPNKKSPRRSLSKGLSSVASKVAKIGSVSQIVSDAKTKFSPRRMASRASSFLKGNSSKQKITTTGGSAGTVENFLSHG